nr:F5I14.16 [Arabidopsis thaliana]
MSFLCVRTVSRFRSLSRALAPGFLLLHGNAVPKTAVFFRQQSSNTRLFSSYTAPSGVEENNSKSALKNKLPPGKEVSSKDAKEKITTSAIDLALNSVVKVFTVSSKPRLFQPWQITMQSESTGSGIDNFIHILGMVVGFVISGKKILTNAHVVANQTSVKVRKHGSTTKYKAKVQAVGHECDLAILEIDNDKFWEGMNPLELGDIPSMQDTVYVVGYPKGGDTISVSKGVVSRVGPIKYSHSGTELLAIQIDAAINNGNSGGPVIMGNKVAGVAFESLCYSDSIGYIIPTPVIRHFLNAIEESGEDVSFGSINLTYQKMDNDQLRKDFKMSDKMTGILINKINPLSDVHKVLKKDDIILAIDGVPIGNDSSGKMPKKAGEQVVIISQILEDDINTGYSIFEDFQVKKVNGVQVHNLKHLYKLVEECCTETVRMDLEKDKVITLDYKSAKKVTSKILKSLKIPSAVSEDLQPKQQNKRSKVPPKSKEH